MLSPATFEPKIISKSLIRRCNFGSLATLSVDGAGPYCSLVNVATMPDGALILLISRMAVHTKNILADPRVSLLLSDNGAGDPLEGTRVSVSGTISEVDDNDLGTARRRYLARHPASQVFVNFKDFSFFKLIPASAHLVAGFGRIASLAGTDLMTMVSDAEEVLSGEASAVEHMNEDHSDANHLYATKLLGGPDGAWQMTGFDPEGADLALGRATLRLTFPERVTTGLDLRKTLVALVGEARAKG